MIKVANINISADNCGPYVITLTGADAIYFKVINKELYFLLEKPYICTTSYAVTVSITDLANRFTPKTAVYNLSTPYCSCTTSTSTTLTSTTVSPTTSPSTTLTSTTASPAMVNFANFNNIATWGGLIGNVTSVGTNGGPSAYGTYDQSGNVDQWNDLDGTPGSSRGLRGGGGFNDSYYVSSSYRYGIIDPSVEINFIGFRLASLLNPLGLSNFVTVGDLGNVADTNSLNPGYGAVAYGYKIGSLLVTNDEYILFLKAVASTDTYRLYNVGMNGSRAGITRSGSRGSYTYTVKTNYGNKPVVYVSWFDCARYCNWLHNDKGSGSTETGAYNLSGAAAGQAPAKTVGAKYWIPTENEWYKAAYYSPNYGGAGVGGYWRYATQSNLIPTPVCATPTGDGIVCVGSPTFGSPTATADGFTVQVTNYNALYTWAGTATASGTVAIDGTGLVTVTGVAAGTSSTATITTTRTGYTTGTADVTATSLVGAALTPTFGTPTATATGFTVQVTNYSSAYTWAGTATASGSVVVSGSGLVTVTGVAASTSATATITATRSGYTTGTAAVTATSLNAALIPEFDTVIPTDTGFTMQITNYDPAYTWAGTTLNTSIVISGRAVTVTGVNRLLISGTVLYTATITTTRAGWSSGSRTMQVIVQQ